MNQVCRVTTNAAYGRLIISHEFFCRFFLILYQNSQYCTLYSDLFLVEHRNFEKNDF